MNNWLVLLRDAVADELSRMEEYGSASTYLLIGVIEEVVPLTLGEAKDLKALLDALLK